MAQQAQVSEEQARAVAEESRESGWDKPSLAKELFLGRFPLDLIHPFPVPSDDEATKTRDFLAKLREFLDTVDGSVIERDAQIPDEYVKGLAELGCFGMKIPSEYGGLGLSQVAYNRALMLVSTVHASLGALLSAHQSIGVPEPLKLAGTDEQKQKFLPRCAAGAISAFLLTEPDVGSDPARLASTATPVDGGAAYELDGVKLWTTNGVVAELLVVMARVPKSDGHRGGISAFVVEADSPGITVERRNKFMGLRGIENGLTRLHRVRVPAENLIGREGDGLKIALTTLNAGRLAIPAIAAGASKWSLKIAREWAGERVQWGKPVGEHGAVVEKISFMAATSYALESVLELSGQMADEGRNDIRIEAALAKLWSSEMSSKIGDELLQIRGGAWLRNRRVAGRAWRASSAGGAGGPRLEDQPHLRRLQRDHATADRPRGRRRTPQCCGRPRESESRHPPEGEGGRGCEWVLRKVVAAVGVRRRTTADGVSRVRQLGDASAFRRALRTQAGPEHLLRNGALASGDGTKAGIPRPGGGYRRRVVRDGRDMCAGRSAARRRSGPWRAVLRAGRNVLSASHPAGGSTVRSLVDQYRRR